MKKLFSISIITLLISLFFVTAALASDGDPGGGCPPNLELHHLMDHSDEHMHPYIGVDQDLNSDGYLCMKMLPNDLHLHVDNSMPLP